MMDIIMEPVHKRPYPTAPIMKRRFAPLTEKDKRCVTSAAEQFKAASRCLREFAPEQRFYGMQELMVALWPHVIELAKPRHMAENNPLLLFTLDALSLKQIYNASAPLLEDLYSGLTAEPAWGVPINLDRDDIRAQPLIALHEFIDELILAVKKMITPAAEAELHEGAM